MTSIEALNEIAERGFKYIVYNKEDNVLNAYIHEPIRGDGIWMPVFEGEPVLQILVLDLQNFMNMEYDDEPRLVTEVLKSLNYGKSMKIIFLDMDGVLNGYTKFTAIWYRVLFKLKLSKYYDLFSVHESKVRRLAKIVKKTGAKVVISSCWRGTWYKDPERYSRTTRWHKLFEKYEIEVIGITSKVSTAKREEEINKWFKDNDTVKVDSFVVIDDEVSDLESFRGSHLIQTNNVKPGEIITKAWYEHTGLRRSHIKPAIEILNEANNGQRRENDKS